MRFKNKIALVTGTSSGIGKKIVDQLIKEGMIDGDNDLYIKEYTSGVLAYLQFFYSPLKKELEFFGIDKRHESNI